MEENLGLPPFYIGQKVVYLTGLNMPKGTIKTVEQIVKFDCGCYLIGFSENQSGDYSHQKCDKHDSYILHPGVILWAPKSFVPLLEQKFPLIKLSRVIEENLELVSSN